MDESKNLLTEIKYIIRSLLLSCTEKITIKQLCADYRDLNGKDLPYQDFGYTKPIDFIENMSDVVRMEWIPSMNDFGLSAIADSSTQHIQNMVARQKRNRRSKRKKTGVVVRPQIHAKSRSSLSGNKPLTKPLSKPTKPVSKPTKQISKKVKRNVHNQSCSLVPFELQNEILELLSCNRGSMFLEDFQYAYKTHFKKDFPLKSSGYSTLKQFLKHIPNISVEYNGVCDIVRINPCSCCSRNTFATYSNIRNSYAYSPCTRNILSMGAKHLNHSLGPNPVPISKSLSFNASENKFNCCTNKLQDSSGHSKSSIEIINDCLQQKPKRQMKFIEDKLIDDNLGCLQNDLTVGNKSEIYEMNTVLERKSPIGQIKTWPICKEAKQDDSVLLQNYPESSSKKPKLSNSVCNISMTSFDENDSLDDILDQEFKKLEIKNKTLNIKSIPDNIKREFLQVLIRHKNGIFASDFLEKYYKITGKNLNLSEYGFHNIMELVVSFPDIFKIADIEKDDNDYLLYTLDKVEPNSNKIELQCSQFDQGSSFFSNSLKANIIKVLSCLKETPLDDFEKIYKNKFGSELPWIELGYDNAEYFMLELSDYIPIKLSFKGSSLFVSLNIEEYESIKTNIASNLSSEIPSDSVVLGEKYVFQQFPKNLTSFMSIYISEIENPSLFWIQLKGEETSECLEILMENLQILYKSKEGDKYKFPEEYLAENNVCAALWPVNNNWHRGIITKILNEDLVEIFYVDYGSKCYVQKQFLRLLKQKFLLLPCQAIKARLANIEPLNDNEWCERAKKRFVELCINKPLVAVTINNTQFKDIISICIYDMSNKQIINVREVLIKEKLAIFADNIKNSIKGNMKLNVEQEIKSNVKNDIFGEIFEESDDFYHQLCKSIEEFDFSITEIFSDSYEIHIIVLNQKPFMSSGDIAFLFQKSEGLERLLLTKKVLISYIILERSGNERLFAELYRNKIKGINESSNQIVIYPLNNVVEILTCLEHPSQNLKNDIKMEIKIFDSNTNITEMPLNELQTIISYEEKKRKNIIKKMLNGSISESYVEEVQRIENRLQLFLLKIKDTEKRRE